MGRVLRPVWSRDGHRLDGVGRSGYLLVYREHAAGWIDPAASRCAEASLCQASEHVALVVLPELGSSSLKETTQFCVGLEDKPGMLAELCATLRQGDVNIDALFVSHDEGVCWVNLVAHPTEGADRLLGLKGYNYYKEQVLVLRIEDHTGRLEQISTDLAKAKVNINYVYGGCADGACTVVLHVSDLPAALRLIG